MASPLVRAIDFFRDFGIFDVVLPFLLVFTLVFAVLEKTRILGYEKSGDREIPNKNINSMVAFAIAFMVVAASNIVGVINESLPNVILLLVVSFSFLLLVGAFLKTEEMDFPEKHKWWYAFFVTVIFIGVVLIFLGAIKDKEGKSILIKVIDYFQDNVVTFAGVIIVIIIIATIIAVTRTPKITGEETKKGG